MIIIYKISLLGFVNKEKKFIQSKKNFIYFF